MNRGFSDFCLGTSVRTYYNTSFPASLQKEARPPERAQIVFRDDNHRFNLTMQTSHPTAMTPAAEIRILYTDLDGTLLNSKSQLSTANHDSLLAMGREGVVRVIVTGRSLFSYSRLFSRPLPADYLIFSTGAGIYDLHRQKLLYKTALTSDALNTIIVCLQQEKVDFMVHHQVPDNHRFLYWKSPDTTTDFSRRLELYADYAREYTPDEELPKNSAQVIAIFPDDLDRFRKVEKRLDGYQITRTTSPLDHSSIWMEIQPADVSKGAGAAWLCRYLGLSRSQSLGIGNDYNDLSLLQYTGRSFLVANAPADLHNRFVVVPANDEDGFAQAVRKVLERL